MLLAVFLLAIGFVLLIQGANWLVGGASSLAKRFNVSELVIGLTIVAFGTSAPELVVNVLASVSGANDITLGNIIGSNNFNLFFILGIAGLIYPLSVHYNTVWREIPYSLLAVVLMLLIANDVLLNGAEANKIDRTDGIILLLFFVAFLYYAYLSLQSETIAPDDADAVKDLGTVKSVLLVVLGFALLIGGGKLVVDNAVSIAQMLQLSEKLIGLTIVAAGTSLPELATSAVAAFKKRSDIAVGNVVGSNIFNLFFILGTSAVIKPISFNTAFNADGLLLIAGTVLLFGVMFTGKRHTLSRLEAGIFCGIFLLYMVYLVLQG